MKICFCLDFVRSAQCQPQQFKSMQTFIRFLKLQLFPYVCVASLKTHVERVKWRTSSQKQEKIFNITEMAPGHTSQLHFYAQTRDQTNHG